MNFTYYSFKEVFNCRFHHWRHKPMSVLENINYATLDLAIADLLKVYNFQEDNKILDGFTLKFDDLYTYQTVKKDCGYFEKIRKKDVWKSEMRNVKEVKDDYSLYSCSKNDFSRINSYGYRESEISKHKGYYLIKNGPVTRTITYSEKKVSWSTPLYVRFYSADFIHTKEIKEEGKSYSPAKYEVVNEKAISEWLPIYYYKGNYPYSDEKFFLSDKGDRYCLTDSVTVTEEKLEIIESL